MFDTILSFLVSGLLDATWWQILLYTLVTTHITILAVTIFLHRAQAHRALDLHPSIAHFFRFWLWLTTGMVTKEFVAVHRKHHAKVETAEDPHSPQTYGLQALLLMGVELYRAEAIIPETVAKYGFGTPDDWIERHLYTRYSWQGVGLMLILDLFLFGGIGVTVWAVQMVWIPWWATGVINGLGHYWGYRNFEIPDASTNVSPWGILIGGEELHNNHHTYPTSAKFSVKPYEFDIGWVYIRAMEMVGLATVRHVAPSRIEFGPVGLADEHTLNAVIAHRYELMAEFAAELRRTALVEARKLRSQGVTGVRLRNMKVARQWLYRDQRFIPQSVAVQLRMAVHTSPELARLMVMREKLRGLWTRTNASANQLVTDLQIWCKLAEMSGNEALQNLSFLMRAMRR